MNRENGFTLVELMIGLAIAAIVLTIGVPSFTDLVQNNRMTSQVNQVVSAMVIARSEAIKRGQNIDITATSGSANWKGGWTVAVAGGGDTIRVFEAQQGDHALAADGGQSSFRYDSEGFLNTACAANCTISLCIATGETGRQLTIAPSGHVSVDRSYVCP